MAQSFLKKDTAPLLCLVLGLLLFISAAYTAGQILATSLVFQVNEGALSTVNAIVDELSADIGLWGWQALMAFLLVIVGILSQIRDHLTQG